MKNWIIGGFTVLFLTACGNNTDTADGNTTAVKERDREDPMVQKGLELAAGNDCFGCHKIEMTLTGPSYREVAARYADSSSAILDTLANRIIHGSSGHWGEMQMTPHPALSHDDAKAMVVYILSLNQQQ